MSGQDRRQFLHALGWGAFGATACPWVPQLAARMAGDAQRQRQCLLLWMTGGPSQLDTFDPKPGQATGGEFSEKPTSVPGIRISEHLPQLAQRADQLAIVRSVSTKEGDHGRGTYLMRTGQRPMGSTRHPSIGASLAKTASDLPAEVPGYVSIAPYRVFNPAAFGPGFLGPSYAPITVGATDNIEMPDETDAYVELRVDDLTPMGDLPVERQRRRLAIWRRLQDRFLETRHTSVTEMHNTVYERALRLMDSPVSQAFDLQRESAATRDAYGKGRFGQGCLMARRLIEQGVPFVEVSLGSFAGGNFGWDTHQNNFPAVQRLSGELDQAWSNLLDDLDSRGLLDTTTILWMGEFGRTPDINPQGGRDHFPGAWTCVFAGGGIQGGQVYGSTDKEGREVAENPVDQSDILTTLCTAIGIDPETEHITPQGRPVKIAEGQLIPIVAEKSV